MTKILLASILAAVAHASNGITASCNDDNTISVVINQDINATVLSAKYGACNLTSDGLRGFETKNVKSWTGTLSPSQCDMDDKLRNLKYNQTAEFIVGRSDGDNDLIFSTFEVDTYCEYQATYTVSFDYGTVDADANKFDQSGGIIGLQFFIESTNEHFNETKKSSTTAGDAIYLTLQLNSTAHDNFDYAKNMTSDNGKAFVPTICYVADSESNNYTLFDTSKDECSNDFIGLKISYNSNDHIWQFEHLLFLLDSEESSTYTLTCDITVCDMSKGTVCKESYDCLIPTADECVANPAFYGYHGDCEQSFQRAKATLDGAYRPENYPTGLCDIYFLGGHPYYTDNNGLGDWKDQCCPDKYAETQNCGF